jgi:hypothetical protein
VAGCDPQNFPKSQNYLIKKLFTGGLGILPIENQARL